MALSSILHKAMLVRRVYVPLYILPLSRVVSSLINMALSMVALVIVILATGTRASWTMLLFPVPLIHLFFFCFGVSLLLSARMVFFRDLAHLYSILTLIIMYLSFIFYPETIIPERFSILLTANPVYHFIKMFRNVVLYNTPPTWSEHLICTGFALRP